MQCPSLSYQYPFPPITPKFNFLASFFTSLPLLPSTLRLKRKQKVSTLSLSIHAPIISKMIDLEKLKFKAVLNFLCTTSINLLDLVSYNYFNDTLRLLYLAHVKPN